MNVSNISFCSSNPKLIPAFESSYILFSALFLIYAIVYIIISIRTSNDSQITAPGSSLSQISFIVCLIVRGLGFLANGILIAKHISLKTISLFTSGFPGYVTAVAYTFIFFFWCNLCAEVLSNDYKTFFFKTQKSLFLILSGLAIAFIVAMIIFFTENNEFGHTVEAIIASLRDAVLSFYYFIYLIRIKKLFKTSCCDLTKQETRLYIICTLLALALFYRAITIQVYTWYYSSRECSKEYLGNLIFDMLATEVIPLFAIGIIRICGIAKDEEKPMNLDLISTSDNI